jgi:hypothetical protein
MNRTEQDHVLTVARDALLAVLPDAWAIYVFGSFARGEEGLGSVSARRCSMSFAPAMQRSTSPTC